jgi:hypothetical protein
MVTTSFVSKSSAEKLVSWHVATIGDRLSAQSARELTAAAEPKPAIPGVELAPAIEESPAG